MYLKMLNIMAKNPLKNPYVQSGLIFLLDGLDISSSTLWVDKIGGIQYIPQGSVLKGNNCFIFPGSNGSYMLGNSILQGISGNDYTIEIVMSMTKQGLGYIFYQGQAGLHLVWDGSAFTTQTGTSPKIQSAFDSYIATYSIFRYGGYKNLQPLTPSGSDYWGNEATYSVIGGAANGRCFGGSIYAIRVYNRVLTQEEISQNQQSDIERFGITI